MARETRTTTVDDLDGSEGARTYGFPWQSMRFEIDLTDVNRDALLRALEPYIKAARRRSKPSNGRPATDAVTGGPSQGATARTETASRKRTPRRGR